ncbi:hypothetical protein DAI22_07g136500 [Oryza sativa Japonica Group]|nr:hypothetical protein DAI22_07g136500 [Oryza sativa Japonica Group]
MLSRRNERTWHRIASHPSLQRPPSKAAQNATTHTTLHSRREGPRRRRREEEKEKERERERMILVAIVAELLEEYTAAVARAMELLLSRAPPRIFPRRVRFLVLRSLPFASPPPSPLSPPPPFTVAAGTR